MLEAPVSSLSFRTQACVSNGCDEMWQTLLDVACRSRFLRASTSLTNPECVLGKDSVRATRQQMLLAREAKRRVESVSFWQPSDGAMLATMALLAEPPRESRNKNVNLLSRKRTCCLRPRRPSDSDITTSVRVLRLLLMAPASLTRRASAAAPPAAAPMAAAAAAAGASCRSAPARSTKLRLDVAMAPSACRRTATVKTACEREERSFMRVAATFRCCRPLRSTCIAWSRQPTSSFARPST
mmetsp:Transcript_38718/g.124478  ORF Transcript_38718/g.124478 Transcript_38718/m.124478 type:complete len:241 (-) Transcript_38718:623-1345(-)